MAFSGPISALVIGMVLVAVLWLAAMALSNRAESKAASKGVSPSLSDSSMVPRFARPSAVFGILALATAASVLVPGWTAQKIKASQSVNGSVPPAAAKKSEAEPEKPSQGADPLATLQDKQHADRLAELKAKLSNSETEFARLSEMQRVASARQQREISELEFGLKRLNDASRTASAAIELREVDRHVVIPNFSTSQPTKNNEQPSFTQMPNKGIFVAGDLKKVSVAGIEQCEQLCLDEPRCKMVEFYRPAKGCNLFSRIDSKDIVTSVDAILSIKKISGN